MKITFIMMLAPAAIARPIIDDDTIFSKVTSYLPDSDWQSLGAINRQLKTRMESSNVFHSAFAVHSGNRGFINVCRSQYFKVESKLEILEESGMLPDDDDLSCTRSAIEKGDAVLLNKILFRLPSSPELDGKIEAILNGFIFESGEDAARRCILVTNSAKLELLKMLSQKLQNRVSFQESLDLALIESARENDLQTLMALTDLEANVNFVRDGVTALFYAARNGNVDMTLFLIGHGADHRNEALVEAAKKGSEGVAKILLAAEPPADVNFDGGLPIRVATINKHDSMVTLLLNANVVATENSALIHACQYRMKNSIVELIAAGAPVAAKSACLMHAARHSDIALTTMLLKQGANAQQGDSESLKEAVENNNLELAQLLLEHGASAPAKDNRAIVLAAVKGNMDMLQLLESYGASITSHGAEMMEYASKKGLKDVCSYLEGKGVQFTAEHKKYLRWAHSAKLLSPSGLPLLPPRLSVHRSSRANSEDLAIK